MKKGLVTVDWINLILETLVDSGIDRERLIAGANINPASLENPFSQVDASITNRIWKCARELSGNDHIGLLLGKASLDGVIGAGSYGLILCDSVKETAEHANFLLRHLTNALDFSLDEKNDGVLLKLVCKPSLEAYGNDNIDALLAYINQTIEYRFKGETPPLKVFLAREEPADSTPYSDLFRCPVEFNMDYVGILIRRDFYESKQPTGNSILREMYRESFLSLFKRESASCISEKIRRHIYNSVPIAKDISLDSVSELLNFSKSTLKRKLKEEGYTFREILDETRIDLAKDMMKNKSLSLQEISYQLGYTETSPFFRAFKRWHGCTPTQYLDNLSK